MSADDQLAPGVFFIVGTGRSGTTLLQAMLTSHPRIAIPPETKFFQRHDPGAAASSRRTEPEPGSAVDEPPLDDARFDAWLEGYLASEDFTDLGLDRDLVESHLREASPRNARGLFLALLTACRTVSNKPRLGEKSPLHARCVPRIRAVLPEAKFIHIYRDPRDVVASMRGMDWTQGTVRGLARTWFKTLREHLVCLREVPEDHYTGVRLETLIEQPEDELRRLCAFLGEDFDPAMLDFHQRSNVGYAEREADWKEGTRRPLGNQSTSRFRHDLTMRQIAQVERIVGPLLERFEYEPHARWRRDNPLYITLDAIDHLRSRLAR
jgi:plasmid stabilization system protein ParE